MIETRRRSLVKSLSWRVTATIVTTGISWAITKEWSLALSIGSIEFFSKIILYYMHERFWGVVQFGKKNCEYHI